jgi:hypothetical protein
MASTGFTVKAVLFQDCIATAKKVTSMKDPKSGTPLSEIEWQTKVEARAKELFEKTAKPKLIGLYWDFPDPAREFIRLAKRDRAIREAEVVHRKRQFDASKKKSVFIVEPIDA